MNRLLFEKRGDAVYLSHLDLMRVFQRAFKRADILIWHSQASAPGRMFPLRCRFRSAWRAGARFWTLKLKTARWSCRRLPDG